MESGIPAVTPPGGLACHVDAHKFLPHVDVVRVPGRGAGRGGLPDLRHPHHGARHDLHGPRSEDGNELASDLELVRFAVPRRVYTMSHIEYSVDRIKWLYEHRHLVKGLKFIEEPPVLRFFLGRTRGAGQLGRQARRSLPAPTSAQTAEGFV